MTLVGEMFPADPVNIGALLDPMGLDVGPVVPTREWRELYAALDCAVVAGIHPFYTASFRAFENAGRPIVGSAPVGRDGTREWLRAVGEAAGVSPDAIGEAQNRADTAIRRGPRGPSDPGAHHHLGLRGLRALVARLLKESGADVRYVGTACPRTSLSEADRAWLESYDIPVTYRASLEQDLAAIEAFEPDLAIGTTPVVQKAKEKGIPSLYFTNLISARPLMGPAGAGSLAEVVNTAMGRAGKMGEMKSFFEGVGEGWAAGVWEKAPSKPKPKRKGKTLISKKPDDVVKGSIVEDV